MSKMFAYHATTMSNTLGTSTSSFMAILLSHYRPSGTIFDFTDQKRIQQRLALYQGVCPIYTEFSDDAEVTFTRALDLLQKQGMVKSGERGSTCTKWQATYMEVPIQSQYPKFEQCKQKEKVESYLPRIHFQPFRTQYV